MSVFGDPIFRRVIKLTISLIFYVGMWLRYRLRTVLGQELTGTCVVLYYHAVPTEFRKRFADQMDLLTRYAKPVRSDIKGPLKNGAHHVAVTFHDAFASVCDNALPEMACRGIPATLFVPTGYLGKSPSWSMSYEHPDQNEVVIDIDRLRSLDSRLVAIGSHSVTHPDLTKLSEHDALQELQRSKLALESILDSPVDLFAFPYGGWNNNLLRLSKQAGYARTFTIEPALLEVGEYAIGSFAVTVKDWRLEFTLKLLGAYQWRTYFSRARRQAKLIWRKWDFVRP